MFRARTGFPLNVLVAERAMGVPFANIFRPDLRLGEPVWLNDAASPAGRRLNPAAFASAGTFQQGGLGRNAIAGFGMSQLDLSLRRAITLSEGAAVEMRIEAFNVFNQANFSDPVRFLANPLFGEPASMLNLMLGTGTAGSGLAPMLQIGGPRSVQVALRFRF
jgi:hypothetical protein